MRKQLTLFFFLLGIQTICFSSPIKMDDGHPNDAAKLKSASSETLPYFESFDSEDALANWTIIDKNGGSTWKYFEQNVAYLLDNSQIGDDYLISPNFDLESGKIYTFAYQATIPNTSDATESFKVLLINPAEEDTVVLKDYPDYFDYEEVQKEVSFAVPQNGTYNLGFYEYSQIYTFRLMIDNVSLKDMGSSGVPSNISNLTATPAENGELKVTLDFTTPSETWGKDNLTSITAINIYRNGDESTPAGTISNPQPGAQLQWVDENPQNGFNTYKLTIENDLGGGPETETQLYVGIDTPVAVTGVVLDKNEDKAVISWSAPTAGVNNAYINPDELTYRIVRNGSEEIVSDITATTYTDESPINGSDQQAVSYTVYANSTSGESEGATSNTLVFGDPVSGPIEESFKNLTTLSGPWTSVSLDDDGEAKWSLVSSDDIISASPQDEDGGMISFNSYDVYEGSMARMVSPSLTISEMINPVLGFWLYHYRDENYSMKDVLKAQISVDGGEYVDLTNEIVLDDKPTGWYYYEAPLLNYKRSTSVNIGFLGISEYGSNILVDHISIFENPEYDISVASFKGSKRVSINEEETYVVTVKNSSATTVGNYSVVFNYLNGLVQTAQGVSILPYKEQDFEFTVTTDINDITNGEDYYDYYAKIIFNDDEVESNDISDHFNVTVRTPSLPEPQALAAEADDNGISLSWTAPETKPEPTIETVTEDFESYTAFTYQDMGEWTLVDLDQDQTIISPAMGQYENQGEPMAYQVYNTDDVNASDDDVFKANSGVQYLVCPASETEVNNNWLISPLLSGKEQTIKFFAKQPSELFGKDRIVIWYSTTDNHPDSFEKLSYGDYVEVTNTWWMDFYYTLPEGAKYFAIQDVSYQTLYLAIDDITYEASDVDPEVISLVGYNVYRNGTLLTSNPISETSFIDESPVDNGIYTITAIYDKGESFYSNEAKVTTTAVNDVFASDVVVYGTKGTLHIQNKEVSPVVIYNMDGSIVSEFTAASTTVGLKSGFYLVKIENEVHKVIIQ